MRLSAVGILTHTAVYILPLVDMRVLSKLITYLLPLRELLVGLLLGLGLLLGDALLDEGWAHALHVARALLALLLALERRHDLVKVQLLEPVADGDAVRADANVPEALAAAEQLARVHGAGRAQPATCDIITTI